MPHFTAADGASIYFEDAGEGLPLLCLSGLTRNSRDFDYVAPHLDGVRMIRMDYRGRGQSDRTGPDTYTLPRESRDAVALLDHLDIPAAAVLGTSRGGMHGMFLAATAPDRVLGAALNDVGPVLDPGGLEAIMTYLGVPPAHDTLEDAARARQAGATAFPGVPFDRWLQDTGHTVDVTPDGLRLAYDPALREAVAATLGGPAPDLWPLFDALKGKPTALIVGANSDLLPASVVAEMIARHPGLIVGHVPDRGHAPFLDEPQALTALRNWLEQMA
ncbi:alpha/beta fold hydrolase [Pseudooceanicola aestuarii]|uniref:alpha/beta fold hydrolase n=1 Tax=Pseudooceanicola aestuarii TaxID=2697319 RepID=UPI001953C7E7|nr:alpha/beta hydrolase [Pseudooceanicola aestuarii]